MMHYQTTANNHSKALLPNHVELCGSKLSSTSNHQFSVGQYAGNHHCHEEDVRSIFTTNPWFSKGLSMMFLSPNSSEFSFPFFESMNVTGEGSIHGSYWVAIFSFPKVSAHLKISQSKSRVIGKQIDTVFVCCICMDSFKFFLDN